MADATEQRDLVGLEAHPRTAAEAEAAASQLALHLFRRHGQPGRQPLDDDDEGRAV